MRGSQEIIHARLEGQQIARVDIEILPCERKVEYEWQKPRVETYRGEVFGRIEVLESENPKTLDLRCCHGIPVMVIARDYETGWPVIERLIEVEPARASLVSPKTLVNWTSVEGVQAWEL